MKLLKYQHWHFLTLSVLLMGMYFYVDGDASLLKGELWGIRTSTWFLLALLSPIIHQIYVLICWRLELFYNSISKSFGANGFKLYKTVLAYTIAGIIFIPAAYLFYSVKKYFGIDRAFGIDHFQLEIFKNEPFIRQGIFKYTANGMYIFGFFILWIPGLLLLSKAALLVALFNHIYIWVHYYFTELPDIKIIYED